METRLKIVVFGAFGAGKTTLVRTLDSASRHIEADCAGGTTTVGLDFGRIRHNGCTIHLYGTPGQERFSFAREIIATGMDGAILLVDVTVPFADFTRDLAQSLNAAQVPYVVFLNKCDGVAADPAAFAALSGSAKIRRVSARDPVQCRDALLEFAGTLNPRAISRTG